ncbi:NrsF family protein [Geminicoccus roseus]|uniref:NrsF family protein n=1 Tax=Geminicoccus roseus TaxID=404900 RepID=UPI000414A836|nr:NrsF family protein [Geminicoccus roseus]
MRTSDLVDLLARDNLVQQPEGWSLAAAMTGGFVMAVLLTMGFLGIRPLAVLGGSDVLAKLLFTGGLFALSIPALRRSLRPGSALRWSRFLPLIAATGVSVAAVAEMAFASHIAVWRPDTLICLTTIPLLSLPALAILALAARRQAPTNLSDAGLWIGLAAGALSASAYALHCPNDDPVYLAAWYLPAVLIAGLLGRTLGPRLLAW